MSGKKEKPAKGKRFSDTTKNGGKRVPSRFEHQPLEFEIDPSKPATDSSALFKDFESLVASERETVNRPVNPPEPGDSFEGDSDSEFFDQVFDEDTQS
jgi:hypothetical protein